jgi:hypothetical protein
MRTLGDDLELAAGLLMTEGVLLPTTLLAIMPLVVSFRSAPSALSVAVETRRGLRFDIQMHAVLAYRCSRAIYHLRLL